MDIESVQIFLDVYRTGSITATAEEYYLTQPALGKRIANLEKELGVSLFHRGKGHPRVELTQEGKAFCDIAERIVRLYDQAMTLKNNAGKEYLTVASIRSAHDIILPKLVLQLKQHYPDLCVTVEEHHTAEIIHLLENRRIDVGIIQTKALIQSLISRLLYRETYRVVVKKDNPLSANESVKPETLNVEHSIFQVFDSAYENWFTQRWSPNAVKVRVNTTPTAEQYFSDRDDWMIVPAAVARYMEKGDFVSLGIEGEVPDHCVYLCWNADNHRIALQWLLESIPYRIC